MKIFLGTLGIRFFIATVLGFVFCLVLRSGTASADLKKLPAPFPPSPVIERIDFELGSLKRAAPGSDLWVTTWADDGNLYTSWGDGGGFGGGDWIGRVSMGVARIEGGPENWKATNVWGGANPESKERPFPGKAAGILSVGSVLYMSVAKQDIWSVAKIATSTDRGRTWRPGGWHFDAPFAQPAFLNFGRDYAGARDGYVYSYARDETNPTQLILARVSTAKIMDRAAYEFFAGIDAQRRPVWVSDVAKRQPVFTDANGIGWGVRVVYNPGINRYLLTVFHGSVSEHGDGSWGIFDAAEPWGPWTTVAYYGNWIDATPKFGFEFPSKWISEDGQTLWLVFSGTGAYDSFNLVKAELTLRSYE
jgi:hypothetical protein